MAALTSKKEKLSSSVIRGVLCPPQNAEPRSEKTELCRYALSRGMSPCHACDVPEACWSCTYGVRMKVPRSADTAAHARS